jgi:hypothetical protein
MARIVVTPAMFNQVWEEEIRPDLERRHGEAIERLEYSGAIQEFLDAFLVVCNYLASDREEVDGLTVIDWDRVVDSTEIMCLIARKRCSTR